jgi:hypothetical protein
MNKQILRNSNPVFSHHLKEAGRWFLWKTLEDAWANILIPRHEAFSPATGEPMTEFRAGDFAGFDVAGNQFLQKPFYDGLGILAGAGIVAVELSDCVDPDGKIVGRAAEVLRGVPTVWMYAIDHAGVVGLFHGKPDPRNLQGMHPMFFVASDKYPCCLSGTPVPGSSPELADWDVSMPTIREFYALSPSGDQSDLFAWEPPAKQPLQPASPQTPQPPSPEPHQDPYRALPIPNVPSADTTTKPDRVRPPLLQIVNNDRELPDLAADCVQALVEQNDPPTLFWRAGTLVRIFSDENMRPLIQRLTEAAFRGRLARSAAFCVRLWDRKQNVEIPSGPPIDVVRDLMAMTPEQLQLPTLRAIIQAPGFRTDGSLIMTPGYDQATGLYYAPSSDLTGLKIPDQPSVADARLALNFLMEVIADFPFVDRACRASALALLLTPSIRSLVPQVPLFVLTAPQQGTGKTLIAEVVCIIYTGEYAVLVTAPRPNSEEWAKLLAAQLSVGRSVTIFDNLTYRLESDALASILTSGTYEARTLGRSEVRHFPQQTTFIVTGNNVALGDDMSRRCVWIQLNAQTSTPYRRTGFRHPNLKEWARGHRKQLVISVLTLIRAWFAAGQPESMTPVIGSFEPWCRLIGGVLAHAGVEGFLENFDELSRESNSGAGEWEAFLFAILSQRPQTAGTMEAVESRELTTRDVAELIRSVPAVREVLPDELAEPVRRENPQALARGLSKIADRRFGEESIFLTKLPHLNRSGVSIWKIRVGNPVNR